MEITSLNNMLDELKTIREEGAKARAARKAIVDAAQATDEYKQADEQERAATLRQEELETLIRNSGKLLADLDLELPNRLTAKSFTVYKYDEASARDWCFDNLRPALKLDGKTFEQMAKSGNIPAEVVTVEKETRIQIDIVTGKQIGRAHV